MKQTGSTCLTDESGTDGCESKSNRGLSLVEMMVSLSLLAIGVLGTVSGELAAIKISSNSRTNTIALQLAQQTMELMQSSSADEVLALITAPGYPNDPANPIDPNPNDGMAMEMNRRWLVVPNSPEVGVILITIEVDWTDPLGIVRTARVAGLKADA